MKFFFLCLFSLLTTSPLFSQDTASYNANRSQNKLVYSANTIKLFTGQRVCIVPDLTTIKMADSASSAIRDMNVMINVIKQNNEKNICIDFNVVKDEDGKWHSFLIVNNPFDKPINYKAKIFSRKANSYVETSIWDVQPGVSGIEHWPYLIEDIILYEFVKK